MTKIRFWPKGYADEDGPSWVITSDAVETRHEAARELAFLGYRTAAVISVEKPRPPVPPVSEAYCRAMSRNDNS